MTENEISNKIIGAVIELDRVLNITQKYLLCFRFYNSAVNQNGI
jgi:hypothetical protein